MASRTRASTGNASRSSFTASQPIKSGGKNSSVFPEAEVVASVAKKANRSSSKEYDESEATAQLQSQLRPVEESGDAGHNAGRTVKASTSLSPKKKVSPKTKNDETKTKQSNKASGQSPKKTVAHKKGLEDVDRAEELEEKRRAAARRRARRSQALRQKWRKAVTQTIRSRLYAKIQHVHSGRWDEEENLKDAREARSRGLPAKTRRAWERDETADAKRKAKRAKYECRLWRRVGSHHFEFNEFADALEAFKQASALGQLSGQQWLSYARCHMEMFKVEPTAPERLEEARVAYQHVLDHMTLSPRLIKGLPAALLEVSRVYESYGCFEGALSLLGMVVENFAANPDAQVEVEQALFRSVVLMKHLATMEGAPSEALLQTCEAFMERILTDREAREAHKDHDDDEDGGSKQKRTGVLASEELLTLVYAKVCEAQGTRAGQMKALEGYERLFTLRKERYRASESIQEKRVNNAGKYATCEPWFRDPKTWDELAQELMAVGEAMLSVEMSQRREQIQPYQEMEPLLSLAKAHLAYQDEDAAVHHASRAWELDPYRHEPRVLLRKLSPDFRAMFEIEERAVGKIQRHWRQRAWSDSFIDKYRSALVEAWEAELRRRPYHKPTRDKLSYYASHRWRRVFLYQEVAATRIASWFRERITYRKFFKSLRERHVRDLAFLYGKWRKRPFNHAVREEVRRMAAHRYTPPGHRILQLVEMLDTEDGAAVRLQSWVRMWRARNAYRKEQQHIRARHAKRRRKAINRIMSSFRSLAAMRAYQRMKVERRAATTIALFAQKRFRGHKCRVAYQLGREQRRWEAKERATRDAAVRRIQKVWRGYRSRQLVSHWRLSVLEIQKRFRGLQARRRAAKMRKGYVLTIQRTWKRKVARDQYKSLMQTLKLKKDEDEEEADKVVHQARPQQQQLAGTRRDRGMSRAFRARVEAALLMGGGWYRPMGPFGSGTDFRRCLSLPAIIHSPVIDPDAVTFAAGDAHTLASFFSYNGQGRTNQVRSLVLHRADLSDDAALEGLARSLPRARGLHSLAIGDCDMTLRGMDVLCRALLANHRVQEVAIDSMPRAVDDANEEALGRLASDFLLQRFGHLRRLALCRNGLTDIAGRHFAQALASPASTLVSLLLAENQIGDGVGAAMADALGLNRCRLTELDLTGNRLESNAGTAFARCLSSNRTLRTLVLRRNLLRDDMVPVLLASLEGNGVIEELDVAENMFRREKEAAVAQMMLSKRRRPAGRIATTKSEAFEPQSSSPRGIIKGVAGQPLPELPSRSRFRPAGLWGKGFKRRMGDLLRREWSQDRAARRTKRTESKPQQAQGGQQEPEEEMELVETLVYEAVKGGQEDDDDEEEEAEAEAVVAAAEAEEQFGQTSVLAVGA